MSWTSPRTWTDATLIVAADLNQQLRDNTTFLKGVTDNFQSYATTGTFSTSSTSYVDVTSASLTITPKVNRILIGVSGSSQIGTSATRIRLAYKIDAGADVEMCFSKAGQEDAITNLRFVSVTVGVAITIKLRMKVDTADGSSFNNFTFFVRDSHNV